MNRRCRRVVSPGSLLWLLLAATPLAGCSAMEGVNVGASVPIGGVVSVGANKTIGQDRSPERRAEEPPDESEDTESGEER